MLNKSSLSVEAALTSLSQAMQEHREGGRKDREKVLPKLCLKFLLNLYRSYIACGTLLVLIIISHCNYL